MPIVLQKFKVAVNDGEGNVKFEEVEGSEVKNDYDLDLFVYRTKSGKFKVSEKTTGFGITNTFDKKKDAIDEMHKVVNERGVDLIKQKIKEVTSEYKLHSVK